MPIIHGKAKQKYKCVKESEKKNHGQIECILLERKKVSSSNTNQIPKPKQHEKKTTTIATKNDELKVFSQLKAAKKKKKSHIYTETDTHPEL